MKSVREVEEYVIHPNQIKNLRLGQALLYCSKIDRHHAIMNIKKANSFVGRYERKSPPIQEKKLIEGSNTYNQIDNMENLPTDYI